MERLGTHCGVVLGHNVTKECERSIGRVVVADVVKFKRGCSIGRVFCAGGV